MNVHSVGPEKLKGHMDVLVMLVKHSVGVDIQEGLSSSSKPDNWCIKTCLRLKGQPMQGSFEQVESLLRVSIKY